jgi:predicted DCC family thiol-disulfide oxidoreductase YuxK
VGLILFFDGDCAFCSASVRRVFRADRRGSIRFAPLQGKLAAEMGFTPHAAVNDGTMVVFREEDARVFRRSDAWIEVARELGGPWRCLPLIRFIPKALRDALYRLIGRNRFRLSRWVSTCEIPDPELAKRLLG